MNNPLLEDFNTPYQSVPFSKIKNEHFKPAFDFEIQASLKRIEAIVQNAEKPSIENTLIALEFAGQRLERISSLFFNLNSAETNQEIQKIAQEVSPMLSAFANDVRMNEGLFQRIKDLYDQRAELDLDKETEILLEKNYKSFVRNGALLGAEDQKKLRAIDADLAKLSLQFGENVLAETNAYTLHLTEESDLDGLPEGVVEAAKLAAKKRNLDGWVITLDYPSYVPFMTYARSRNLREQLSKAFGSRSAKGNEHDNKKVLLAIVEKRKERAELLGYTSHAHYVLEERMAEKPERVDAFLQDLLAKAKPAAQREFEALKALALELDGLEQIEKWDSAYYSEILKKKTFDLDEEMLKPYFPLDKVLNGVFEIANRLFGLVFEERHDIDRYHEEVRTFEVKNQDEAYKALFYADFFPREGKRNGAWMTSYKSQWRQAGQNSRPHVSIVCNFTPPTEKKPSLLTFNEVTTLFHEFGHALHGMLADTQYPSLSGTSVYWDFVELPSQLMENWCFEKEALELFSGHYEHGEKVPLDLVEKIKKSSNFLEGLATLRQLSFGMLDMAYHHGSIDQITDVDAFEKACFEPTNFYPEVKGSLMSTAFSHIFQGGYAAGYYSYKWAEVLDADAFESFKEKGIFDKETAASLERNILSQGGTEKPMTLYKKFRGKAPSPEALLKRAGLLSA